MIRASVFVSVGLLAGLSLASRPGTASAEPHALRLHVEGHLGSGGSALDLVLPWDSDEGRSPFDFTHDACDDLGLERLRWAWSELGRLPEGQSSPFRRSRNRYGDGKKRAIWCSSHATETTATITIRG